MTIQFDGTTNQATVGDLVVGGTLTVGGASVSVIGQPQMAFAAYPTTVFNSKSTPLVNTGTGTFTWTCPAGVTKVKATVIAGGGGANNDTCSTGGGNGGLAVGIYTVVPGTVYTITVGVGGTGATGTGGAGGASSFSSFCSATGGGGALSTGGAVSGSGTGGNIRNLNISGIIGATSNGLPAYIQGNIPYFGSGLMSANTIVTTPIAWTINSTYSAGARGASGPSGAVSGVVALEWIG